MDYLKQNHLSLVIILYLVIAPFLGGIHLGALDRTTVSNPWTFAGAVTFSSGTTNSGTTKIGSTGTSITRVNTGTCYILAYATTIAASSSANVDCQGTAAIGSTNNALATALTGVTVADNVVVTLSTTTSAATGLGQGLVVTGASASTTAGYIQLRIANNSGGTFTWPTTGTATGTAAYVITK